MSALWPFNGRCWELHPAARGRYRTLTKRRESLLPPLPISRLSAVVCDRDNLHCGSFDAIDQREGKAPQTKSSMFRIESWSQGLMLAQARASTLDFDEKLLPETRHTVFVEDCCRPQFGVCCCSAQ